MEPAPTPPVNFITNRNFAKNLKDLQNFLIVVPESIFSRPANDDFKKYLFVDLNTFMERKSNKKYSIFTPNRVSIITLIN